MEASCSLVKGAPYEGYLKWRQQHRDGIAVTYINSSTEVKSISDVIITSSNAAQIVEAIPKDRKILFGPDQHLGRWLSKKLDRKFEFWNGACEVHVLFNAQRLAEVIHQNPDALIMAHPECDDSILAYANVIGSTSHLLESVSTHPHKKFIVATETGIFHEMQKRRPDATFIQAPVVDEGCKCNDCPYMKMNNMEKIKRALETLQPEITLPEALRLQAKTSLDRMMDITSGKPVTWPKEFAL
jgi:quinolinate synthase